MAKASDRNHTSTPEQRELIQDMRRKGVFPFTKRIDQ